MWHFNLCHDFRYGKIMYNQLDQYVGKSLRLYGEFSQGEADIFEQIVKPGHIVVEAGANIGSHTIHLAQLAGDTGQVWAFEPQRLVFQLLAGNVALNSLANVHCMQNCLGDVDGQTVMVPVLDVNVINNWGGLELGAYTEGEPVRQLTIDSLHLPGCNFIKIDVEGMELQVLRGAEETIRKHRPIIYTEADRDDKKAAQFSYLRSLGYRLYQHQPPLYNPNNYFHNPENVFTVEQTDSDGTVRELEVVSFNALCLPEDSPIQLKGFDEIS
jgi:FkbM family methyltransferase